MVIIKSLLKNYTSLNTVRKNDSIVRHIHVAVTS